MGPHSGVLKQMVMSADSIRFLLQVDISAKPVKVIARKNASVDSAKDLLQMDMLIDPRAGHISLTLSKAEG